MPHGGWCKPPALPVVMTCVKGDTRSLLLLLDNTGAVVVKYKYDAWGKCQTTVAYFAEGFLDFDH